MTKRLAALAAAVAELGCEVALISGMVNMYYLTGTIQTGFLVLVPGQRPLLAVRKGLERAEKEAAEAGVEIVALANPKDLPSMIAARGVAQVSRIGLELDRLPYQSALRLLKLFPSARPVDVGGALRRLRMLKDRFEVAAIRRTGEVWVKTMDAVLQSFEPGIDEYELTLRVESASRQAGHQGLVRTHALDFEIFLGHLLSGPHGAVPTRFDGPTGGPGVHPATAQGAGHRPIGPGDPVLADYACAQDGYIYDGTRTFVHGALGSRLQRAYDVCRTVHEMLQTKLRVGGTVAEVTTSAFDLAEAAGLEDHFMGYGVDRVRFLGHGVGLELDELPVLVAGSTQALEAGMVIAVEPKFVFPGEGAVGLETTYLVGEGPPEALVDYPDGVIALGGA